MTFYAYFGSGPNWFGSQQVLVENCYKYWWANLLFIANFWKQDDSCDGALWYVFNEFQFFLILPVLMWVYLKSRKLAYIACFFLLLCNFSVTIA